ncbi:tRNA (adenosine(37)-N6)-threonylcarbamoyltransferase complex ATPase subunit type 1 TsaE [Candidatus Saccharibacteria bacterium]|nr:tRNA (adenosine(37)-N6)-threonylcarbamoyltransferase complex ATPase subunit type 1 TsaE [Candidatus Saccharibacteria bacterium]
MKVDSEQSMLDLGKSFAGWIKRPAVIELVGDVGAGKTTLVRGLAEGLGVTETATSPSFTISKAYALPDGGRLVHYDFYRLNDPGLMAEDLEENLADKRNVVVIEWGESVGEILPEERMRVEIKYNEDGTRGVIL